MTKKDSYKTKQQLINELVMLRRRIAAFEVSETKRKEMQEHMVRPEKLTELGQIARGIGHELRNSLGAIRNATYFLNMALEEPEPEVKEALEILERGVGTSEGIIRSLIDFARPKDSIQ